MRGGSEMMMDGGMVERLTSRKEMGIFWIGLVGLIGLIYGPAL